MIFVTKRRISASFAPNVSIGRTCGIDKIFSNLPRPELTCRCVFMTSNGVVTTAANCKGMATLATNFGTLFHFKFVIFTIPEEAPAINAFWKLERVF